MDWIVRRAILADREAVFSLVVQFATSFRPQQLAFEASFERLLSHEAACLLVAVSDERIIGYCLGFTHDTFYANGPVAWIEEIMVQESFRRHGVGEMMMQDFESWAASRGVSLVALATRRASSFYQSIGYEDSAVYFRKKFCRGQTMTRPIDIKTHLDLLEETLNHLKACLETLDEAGLTRQPAPGEWSAVEVLAHLRAAAEVFSHSIYMCLLADQPVIPYIHPNEWWTMQGYSLVSFDENWQSFQLNRQHLLRKLRSLTPEQWERSCIIKTQTRTVYGEMRRMALHEKGHYSQIDVLCRLE